MGAPGYHYFCTDGHLFYEVPSRLYWDENVYQEFEAIKVKGCPCGKSFAIETCFYNEIFDCLDPEEAPSKIGSFEILKRISAYSTFDVNGNPIDAYIRTTIPQFDIHDLRRKC